MHLETAADWLRALVPVLLAGQPEDWVRSWRRSLQGLGGPVSFRVVHAWQAEVVLSRLPGNGTEDIDHAALAALQQLHRRAALGLNGRRGEWLAALKPLLPALYRRAFPYAAGYARAHEIALEYATAPANTAMIAEHFGDARGYADYYAELSTEANAAAFADANSRAYAQMAASIYADNDAAGYTGICVGATRVWALACAGSGEQDGECRRRMLRELAEGLINS
ncbi:hypothetical protein [Pseudomonas gingeri]|uniref:hypothetical protein n=1 Tax=Pseudomonas gingeri TaxID=117681 RepID=UPI0015A26AB1|nr:hypothetical protein [Pseudomonas gingeri]NWA02230.1 hypothetical protein [Pseudomonas gingeri]NWA17901.1 hypothetical protein [Pseudomonas gingeri]NWA56814.1 hypothetical protein [Pseudomonas gingeri]NWA97117.1 hypothetical protein [Pseudomonas gingeri]NWB03682.1 hypothetical protein [Pseudomonas gingeri]